MLGPRPAAHAGEVAGVLSEYRYFLVNCQTTTIIIEPPNVDEGYSPLNMFWNLIGNMWNASQALSCLHTLRYLNKEPLLHSVAH